jgi:hypothetical protein
MAESEREIVPVNPWVASIVRAAIAGIAGVGGGCITHYFTKNMATVSAVATVVTGASVAFSRWVSIDRSTGSSPETPSQPAPKAPASSPAGEGADLSSNVNDTPKPAPIIQTEPASRQAEGDDILKGNPSPKAEEQQETPLQSAIEEQYRIAPAYQEQNIPEVETDRVGVPTRGAQASRVRAKAGA